jgi:hypothetical protein
MLASKNPDFFFFFYILPLILQKYMVRKKFAKLYIDVRGTRGNVEPATAVGHDGRGLICFQKILIFCLNSDGGKLYMKIVVFDENYNFVVQIFSI